MSVIFANFSTKLMHWSAVELLSIGLVCTILARYAQFHWNRRRLYQLSWNIRGPFAWPVVGSAVWFMGNTETIFRSMMYIFKTYPGICRVWLANDLVYAINKPEYLEIILTHPKSLAKMHLYKFAQKSGGLGLFSAPVDVWKKHRKIITPTFNQKILDRFVEVFSEQTSILVDQLKKVAGKGEFDFFHYFTKCTTDIICETAMGVKMKTQTIDTDLGQKIDKILEIMLLRMFVIWYHSDFLFKMSKHYAIENESVAELHRMTDLVIKRKLAEYKEKQKNIEMQEAQIEENSKLRKAFLDLLIEENLFTDKELRSEVNTFMIAGTDTTASSSCFALMVLGMYPDVQEKVYQEVMDVIGPDNAPEAFHLPQMKYLERVIKESLRLFPVGAFVVRACEEDIRLDEKYTLPKGCSVILGMLHVHKNPEHWHDPLKFDPDRFLPEEVAKRHPYSYIPFSAGPRNCVGPKYAMMAMKSMISMLVRSYKFKTGYKRIEDVKLKTNLVLRPKHGFKISIEERKI